MNTKIIPYFIQIASEYIELRIRDAELLQFVQEEYLLLKRPRSLDLVLGTVEVSPYKNNLLYSFESKQKKEKVGMEVSNSNTVRIKEFILQGFIELHLSNKGIFFMHASSFYKKNDIFVFIGPSGSGKTTILHLLQAKNILSNDTAIFKYKHGKITMFPSPFDKKSGIKKVSTEKNGNIHIYLLSQSNREESTIPTLQDKVNFIQRSMNFFLFIIHGEISPLHLLKQHNKDAFVNMLLLIRHTSIYKLDFTLKLTSESFFSISGRT